jgi:predicted transcriptional regulator
LSSIDSNYVLDQIGINISSRDFRVLKAIIQAQEPNNGAATVDEIHAKIKKKLSKSWIYKCLDNLERQGFISVDKVRRPRVYIVNSESVMIGLEDARQNALKKLRQEQHQIQQHEDILKQSNLHEMTEYVLEHLAGKQPRNLSRVFEGVENVRRVIVEEMCSNPISGDLIRVLNMIELSSFNSLSTSFLETEFLDAAVQGLKVRALFPMNPKSPEEGLAALARFLKGVGGPLTSAIKSGNLQIRARPTEDQTYRMISRNNNKMLLFLTNAPTPDTGALLYRNVNTPLIDDAITTFDALWEESQDITQMLMQSIKSLSAE